MTERRVCMRCYRKERTDPSHKSDRSSCDFPDAESTYCEDCTWEVDNTKVHSRSRWHHDDMMEQKPLKDCHCGCKGDCIVHAATVRGLDLELVRELTYVQGAVCEARDKGRVKIKSADAILRERFGNPEKMKQPKREEVNRLICRYLGASIDSATWLGLYRPYRKR